MSTLDRMAKLAGGPRMILPIKTVKVDETDNTNQTSHDFNEVLIQGSEIKPDIKIENEIKSGKTFQETKVVEDDKVAEVKIVEEVKASTSAIPNNNQYKVSSINKTAKSLFDDDDSSMFNIKDSKITNSAKAEDVVKAKPITSSLFGDDDDIFSSKPKNLVAKTVTPPVESVAKVVEVKGII